MKVTCRTSTALAGALFVASVSQNCDAFSIAPRATLRSSGVAMKMSSKEAEIAALREAAAKAREEAQRLAKELGKDIDLSSKSSAATEKKIVKSLTSDEITTLLSSKISFETDDSDKQTKTMSSMVESGDLSLWNTATGDASLRTYPVTLNFLESRSGGKLTGKTLGVEGNVDVSLDDIKDATIAVTLGSTALGIASLALLPENVGATLCYLIALVPVAFLGIGSTSPGIIADGIAMLKGTADDQVKKDERVCRHEAGHFLCGYLCGLPVKSYTITDLGYPCVEFHTTSSGPATGRELSSEEIAALSVVAMSGSVAEVLSYGEAKGGENDFLELENIFKRSKEFIGSEKRQNLTRWGALTAYNLINTNKDKYEKLVEAFKQKKTVAECVAAVEAV